MASRVFRTNGTCSSFGKSGLLATSSDLNGYRRGIEVGPKHSVSSSITGFSNRQICPYEGREVGLSTTLLFGVGRRLRTMRGKIVIRAVPVVAVVFALSIGRANAKSDKESCKSTTMNVTKTNADGTECSIEVLGGESNKASATASGDSGADADVEDGTASGSTCYNTAALRKSSTILVCA
jgi:hypothetical protein